MESFSMLSSEESCAEAARPASSSRKKRGYFLVAIMIFLFCRTINIYLNQDQFIDLVADDRRNADIEIFWPQPELRHSDEVPCPHFECSRSFYGMGHVVQRKVPFHHDFIYPVPGQIDIATVAARERCLRVFVAFHIVFIKMLLHQFFGEDETFQERGERKVLLSRVDDRKHLVVLSSDVFQRGL